MNQWMTKKVRQKDTERRKKDRKTGKKKDILRQKGIWDLVR